MEVAKEPWKVPMAEERTVREMLSMYRNEKNHEKSMRGQRGAFQGFSG